MSDVSKCDFCGSASYGRNCPSSPYKKTHFHGDTRGKKCCWCGSSTLYGRNCPLSPSGFHGASSNAYTSVVPESFFAAFLMDFFGKPFVETRAFQMGLIDESGNKIKKPETIEEKEALSPTTVLLFKIKKILGDKINLLNSSIYLESVTNNATLSPAYYEKEQIFKKDMDIVQKRLSESIDDALRNGLHEDTIIKVIYEKIVKNK